MATVEIYTTPVCPYCLSAKSLLGRKGSAFTEIDVSTDEAERKTMIKRAGGRMTVPQIFIGGEYIGGCDDLYALDRAGGLDPKLSA